MNERAHDSMEIGHTAGIASVDESMEASMEPAFEFLGAVDIVEAFTTLRHELKLQVRGGRELQQSLNDTLHRLEQRITSLPTNTSASNTSESRKMAEAIAEIEESLQRAIESIVQESESARADVNVLNRYDAMVSKAPWIAKAFAGKWLEDLRAGIAHSIATARRADSTKNVTHRGLELLLARVHRLMKQCEIERVDVLNKPFDAESMNAIDMIVDPQVPSAHVAQQIRPLYRWRSSTLRCAEVRIAT